LRISRFHLASQHVAASVEADRKYIAIPNAMYGINVGVGRRLFSLIKAVVRGTKYPVLFRAHPEIVREWVQDEGKNRVTVGGSGGNCANS
jgi:hypothetical protein